MVIGTYDGGFTLADVGVTGPESKTPGRETIKNMAFPSKLCYALGAAAARVAKRDATTLQEYMAIFVKVSDELKAATLGQ